VKLHDKEELMKIVDRSKPFALLMLAATALGACGGSSESGDPPATAEAGDQASTSSEQAEAGDACPSDAEISEVVGNAVQGRPWGPGCFYETADFDASVAIMRIAAGSADQVEREMRESAAERGVEVQAIEVGERGHAWGQPGMGQGYAVSGDRGWMLDISTMSGGDEDRTAAVIRILEMMID
jgi:hypothetical protein